MTENYQGHDPIYQFDDNFKLFLFKKTERISVALYLVTSHLSSNDALKTDIRKKANNLIKDIIELNHSEDNNNSYLKIKEDFIEINSLLNLASISGLISFQNVSLLIDEINRLHKDIQSHKESLHSVSELKKSFFVVESRPRLVETENIYKGQKEHKGQDEESQKTQKASMEIENYKGQVEKSIQSDRSQEIMKIIKDNGKVTIKDISLRIKDCSEKTIQRELLKMVSLNLIKKEGERRWSTYSLN